MNYNFVDYPENSAKLLALKRYVSKKIDNDPDKATSVIRAFLNEGGGYNGSLGWSNYRRG